jgi:o-succinylbenzoate synthase
MATGFNCIKLKIGAMDFEAEIDLLKFIRSRFSAEEIELRVDANGAFSPAEALEKLKRLSQYNIHSIEQPIKQGQWAAMADLCEKLPFP